MKLFNIKKDERKKVLILFVQFFAVVATSITGNSARDAFFLNLFDRSYLPLMFVAIAFTMVIVINIYKRITDGKDIIQVISIGGVLFAAVLLIIQLSLSRLFSLYSSGGAQAIVSLPEKWMISPRAKLSTSRDIYMTRTTDGINLVWKTSNVGKFPSEEPLSERDLLLNGHGYNSPFEEVAISEELRMMGLPTVNMRAIYRTSLSGGLDEESFDTSRFESHGGIYGPFGEPVLKPGYRYITFWGVTTDSEEGMGMTDEDYHGGLNLTHALRNGVVDVDTYRACVEKEERKLRECGYLDLNVRGGNYLLSYDADGNVINDGIDGLPVLQIANLELISRINGHV